MKYGSCKNYIENGNITFKRAGDFIIKVFEKESKQLSGEEADKIKNWYGFGPDQVVLLAISHGFTIDQDQFEKLLEEQLERNRKMRPAI